ncbi:hypothetical protein CN611_07410 [Bacillus wiedmannii]|uniref:Uncharacterized protein n=2 Tax=Bacillus wiedmannii TaxID=1890302 RepID=A0A2A8BST0_9BACI|nr:hypothetical protein CN611_07410 [Bacillus wiedmannii]
MIDSYLNKKTLIGEVEEREFSYGTGIDLYYDIFVSEKNAYLTEELAELKGKKVRITVEVIE